MDKAKFQALVREYSDKVAQIVREILKDEKFANSKEREINILHDYLAQVSKQYDVIEKFDHYFEFLHYFVTLPKHYMNLPEDQKTANTNLIEELLSKYGMTKLAAEVENEFKIYKETENIFKIKEKNYYDLFLIYLN